jgi:cell division transport system permease protein
MRSFIFCLGTAVRNLKDHWLATWLTVATMAFSFLVCGFFLLVYLNLQSITQRLLEQVRISIYLDDNLSSKEVALLQDKIKRENGIEQVTYISREEALDQLKKDFGDNSNLFKGLGEDLLPASFELKLDPDYQSVEAVVQLIDKLKAIKGVQEVQYSKEWVADLNSFLKFLQIAGTGIGGVLILAVVTLTGTTIRMVMQLRHKEIEVMQLVGATAAFIRLPFLLEGAMMGIVGSGLALLLLSFLFHLVQTRISTTGGFLLARLPFSFFPFAVLPWFLLVGMVLGMLGSGLSAGKSLET